MKKPIIQIHGTGVHNRGAELMACAISRHVHARAPDVRIAVDRSFGTFEERGKYQLGLINNFSVRTPARWWSELAPAALRYQVGLVNRAEVTAVLDASGFAYSDQWGAEPARSLVREMQRPWRRGQKLILLPQAYGPFETPEVRDAVSKLFAVAHLIFARDPDSHKCVEDLGFGDRLRLAPDFTQVMRGESAGDPPPDGSFAAIVPNIRMLDKTTDTSGENYVTFLKHAARECRACGMEPLLVLHDASEDRKLLPRIMDDGEPLRVFESVNPLVLKWMLGSADLVIGSRFHALVSAFSQGVPCLGAGWSHKYHHLFKDFGCLENLIKDVRDIESLRTRIAQAAEPALRGEWKATIRARASQQKTQIEAMWGEVDETIGIG